MRKERDPGERGGGGGDHRNYCIKCLINYIIYKVIISHEQKIALRCCTILSQWYKASDKHAVGKEEGAVSE